MILYELVKFHLVCGLFQMENFCLHMGHNGATLHCGQQALKLKLESAGNGRKKKTGPLNHCKWITSPLHDIMVGFVNTLFDTIKQ